MQGCALRIIEGSSFPWTWEIQGAQDMVFKIFKLPRSKINNVMLEHSLDILCHHIMYQELESKNSALYQIIIINIFLQ